MAPRKTKQEREDEERDAVLDHPEFQAAMEKSKEKSRRIRRAVAGGGTTRSSGEKGTFIYVNTEHGRGYVLGNLTGLHVSQPTALVVIDRAEWNAKHPTDQRVGPCVHQPVLIADLPEWKEALAAKEAENAALLAKREAKAAMKAEMATRGIEVV